MMFDPKTLNALAVKLHGRQIGVINRLGGDRHLFSLRAGLYRRSGQAVLSLSYKGQVGRTRCADAGRQYPPAPPSFRTCCRKGICATTWPRARASSRSAEFFLLRRAGADLPGALVVEPMEGNAAAHEGEDQHENNAPAKPL